MSRLQKRLLFTLFLVLSQLGFSFSSAQSWRSIYAHYMFNGMLINPANIAPRAQFEATYLHHTKYKAGLEQDIYHSLGMQTSLRNPMHNLGLQVVRDADTSLSRKESYTSIRGMYAARFPVDHGERRGKISIGIQGGWNLRDNCLPDHRAVGAPILGFGLMYYKSKDYYLGISVPSVFDWECNSDPVVLSGGILFKMKPVSWAFHPSSVVKFGDNGHFEIHMNNEFIWKDRLWFGGSLRIGSTNPDIDEGAWQIARGGMVHFKFQVNESFRFGCFTNYDRFSGGRFEDESIGLVLTYQANYKRSRPFHPIIF